MSKKLLKYGKFLLSMALIFCLIVPSYASLSASDGSAFVTKGEFDSALADFNSRLTTFEAGINSKIDSQVTSYLDRNGIWSSKTQDLEFTYYYYLYGGSTGSSYSAVTATCDLNGVEYKNLDFKSYISKTSNSSLNYGQENRQVDIRKLVIKEITKSGMLVIRYQHAPMATAFGSWYRSTIGNKRNYMNYYLSSSSSNYSTGAFDVVSQIGFEVENASGEASNIRKDGYLFSGSSSASNGYAVLHLAGSAVAMGFVSQGDKIYYACSFGLVGNSSNGIEIARSANVETGDCWFDGQMMVIEKAEVY